MALNKFDHGEGEIETQPLLGDVPAKAPSKIDNLPSSEPKQSLSEGQFFIKICFLLLGDFLGNADDTFLITIYEQVASEFESADRAAWLILSASLIYSIFMPIYGYLGDRYDNKKIILTAFALLMSGCALTSISPSFSLVMAGRAVACVGGAGLYSMTGIVIAGNAKPSDAGVLRSYATIAGFVGRNTGPIIGGALSDAIGWRKAFLCEIPLALFCALVIAWQFDLDSKVDDEPLDQKQQLPRKAKQDEPMDLLGISLYAVVVTGFVAVLSLMNDTAQGSALLMWSVIVIVFSAALFWHERSLGDRAFIPACVFQGVLGMLFLIIFIWPITLFAAIILIPLYFARVENASSSMTALHMLPLPACSVSGNLFASRLIKITKHYKFVLYTGAFVGAAGFFMLGTLWQGQIGLGKSLIAGLPGLFNGFFNAATFLAITLASGDNQKGTVIGFAMLSSELGCLVGTAAFSTLINFVFERGLIRNSPLSPNRVDIIGRIMRDSKFAFTLSSQWQQVSILSFLKAWKIWGITCGAITIMLQPLIILTPELKME